LKPPRQKRHSIEGAILRFCKRQAAAILEYELHFTWEQLLTFDKPALNPKATIESSSVEKYFPGDLKALDGLWRAALRNLQEQLEDGRLYLEGTEVTGDLLAVATPIPGTCGAEFEFDIQQNAMTFRDKRFVRLAVSNRPSNQSQAAGRPSKPIPQPRNIESLSSDDVLSLLEAHAEWVKKGPDATLIAPGKVSILPLTRSKMRDRASCGELLPTLREEAEWLAAWAKSKAPSHQTPTAKTISKMLGSDYRALKPRSNGATQKN
jgi:hypothetical protein